MGTLELFGRVYGCDLLNVWKSSPAYYRAILADTATDPAAAVVIDDSGRARVGGRVRVARRAREPPGRGTLRELDAARIRRGRRVALTSATRMVRCGPYGLGWSPSMTLARSP